MFIYNVIVCLYYIQEPIQSTGARRGIKRIGKPKKVAVVAGIKIVTRATAVKVIKKIPDIEWIGINSTDIYTISGACIRKLNSVYKSINVLPCPKRIYYKPDDRWGGSIY